LVTTRTQPVTTRHPSFGALRAFSMLNGLVLLGVLLQGVWGGGILGRAGGVDWAFLHELTGSVTVLCSLAATILAVTTLRRHRPAIAVRSVGMFAMLIVQFGLGVGVRLNEDALLLIHVPLAMLIMGLGVYLSVAAARSRRTASLR
jgi:hypothetical protein